MKKKLHYILSFTMLLLCFSVVGQNNHFKKVSNKTQQNNATSYSTYSFDINQLMNDLSKTQQRGVSKTQSNNFVLELPNLKGELESYLIQEASVMAPELQAQYPQIRSYVGYGIDSPTSYLRFSVSPYKGMSGIVLSGNEGNTLVIEPGTNDLSTIAIRKKDGTTGKKQQFECTTPNELESTINELAQKASTSADGILHTFDLAMSVTGEYSTFHGGTLPLVNAAIVNTMTTVNAVFENDFNVTMVLIANNDAVVYLDPNTDPYSGTSDGAYNSTLQTTLDANIGGANYDIGHLMAGIGNNGNAGCIGCVCVAGQKGSGFTTSTVPSGVSFDIDYVAHEMGHQFGGRHTFTFQSEGNGIAQMEPGSGSTIMGYAGITGATDVQSNSDPYFHAISIQQVTAHVATRTCDIETATGNNVPIANAGVNLTLPKGTPFRLTGSATDVDADDALTYCWEQYDENDAANAFPSATNTNSNEPLFRSYLPKTNPTRTFPNLSDLISLGFNGGLWEKVPTVARSADFRLTVRDNKPGGATNAYDDMVVTWSNTSGPFIVTSQNTDQIVWTPGTTETITWDVAGTTANGINAANVNIILSTSPTADANFATVLATNVPNNGSYELTVPTVNSAYSRIMVEAADGSFFNINDKYFAIGNYIYVPGDSCEDYFFQGGILLEEDDTSFSGFVLNIPDSKTISDINVSLDVTTANNGQVYSAIRGPFETAGFNRLAYGTCPGSTDLILTFDDEGNPTNCNDTASNDSVTPLDPLSFADGENSQGDWILYIGDVLVDGDRATWNSAIITVCESGVFIPVLGTDNFELENNFAIYPNPNNGEFNVKFNSTSNNVSVEVFDIRGRSIYTKGFNNSGAFNETINLGDVQSGMYLMNVNDGSRTFTKKIIVE